MKYSPASALALAMLSTASSTPKDKRILELGKNCFDGIPLTNISFSVPGISSSEEICCPGVFSNGKGAAACLIGNCGVTTGPAGLTTTGSCQAIVPITASNYDQRVVSAYNAAGQPSVNNSALLVASFSSSTFFITGVAATPSASSGSIETIGGPTSTPGLPANASASITSGAATNTSVPSSGSTGPASNSAALGGSGASFAAFVAILVGAVLL